MLNLNPICGAAALDKLRMLFSEHGCEDHTSALCHNNDF